MPRDPRKHQKALMKKRSKQKAASQHKSHQPEFMSLSAQGIIRRSRTFPMIYGSIEYAAQFGFTPQEDFALSQYVLAPRGELEEPYHLTFGKNGKPFFIAGPYDNAARILRQLEKNPGPGKFDYFAPLDAL